MRNAASVSGLVEAFGSRPGSEEFVFTFFDPYAIGLGLAWGGAAGNLLDRLRGPHGVVDFIDIGVGNIRFWTFNVADSSVTIAVLLLAWVIWREDREANRAKEAARALGERTGT